MALPACYWGTTFVCMPHRVTVCASLVAINDRRFDFIEALSPARPIGVSIATLGSLS
jgi:hypothetical protein